MNKTELIEIIQNQLINELSKKEIDNILTAILNSIKIGLEKNQIVQILGFGTFKVTKRSERLGVNPKTREKMLIKESFSVSFKPSKNLKNGLNTN